VLSIHWTFTGYFTEISSREVINQFYRIAKTGLRVPETFQVVQHSLHYIDIMMPNFSVIFMVNCVALLNNWMRMSMKWLTYKGNPIFFKNRCSLEIRFFFKNRIS